MVIHQTEPEFLSPDEKGKKFFFELKKSLSLQSKPPSCLETLVHYFENNAARPVTLVKKLMTKEEKLVITVITKI